MVDAAQFLLTGSTLYPMLAAPTVAATPTQPYYQAWAAPPAMPAIPQTSTLTAPLAIKQEQVAMQRAARKDCAFYTDPFHFMGSCPLVDGYIHAGVELCSALGWDLNFLRPSSYVSHARPVGTSPYYWFPESQEPSSCSRPAGLTLFRF